MNTHRIPATSHDPTILHSQQLLKHPTLNHSTLSDNTQEFILIMFSQADREVLAGVATSLHHIVKQMTDIKDIQTDFKDIQTDIQDIRTDIKDIQTDIKAIKDQSKMTEKKLDDIKDIQTDIEAIKDQHKITDKKLDDMMEIMIGMRDRDAMQKISLWRLSRRYIGGAWWQARPRLILIMHWDSALRLHYCA
jgi:DNA repair ATPase RecN